ncbi:TonB-dependent siderophore receptor [Acidovorax sp. SDU_ACID1]|uniref:TonB-dependent siderophore receptor n=1 Tax=Acidovorax sp. SDU_ACID1 TaxID=3136632 RepID=UPI003873C2D8
MRATRSSKSQQRTTQNTSCVPGARHPVTCAALFLFAVFGTPAQAQDATARTLPVVEVTGDALSDGYTSPVAVGGKEPLPVRQIPQSVSVITEQRIRDQNLSTVQEALNQANGVTVIANDSTQSQMRSRGYSLGVSYDGVPAYSALSGYQQFDLDLYERVEVLRGPAGIFSGSGDPGGVVNLVRKRAKPQFGISASASAGSWNNYRSNLDVTGPLNEDKSLRGRAVFSVQDRDYFYDKTHTRRWLAYGTLEWDIARATTLSFSAAIQDDNTRASSFGLPAWTTGGLINAPRSTNTIADWTRYAWQTQEYTAELERRLDSGWLFKGKLSHRPQDFYFKDGYPSSGVDPTTGTLTYARRVRDYTYERNAVDLYATGPVVLFGRRHTLLAGYNRENLSSVYAGVNATAVTGVPFGQSSLVPDFDLAYNLGGDTRTSQSGFYGQARLSIADPLIVVLGGRVSDFNVKSRSIAPATPTNWTQGAKANGEFTPYGAVLYDFAPNWTAYSSYSDIFLPQTQQRVDGSTLDPRSGRQIEVGAKAEFLEGRLQASAAYFQLRDRNRSYADPVNTGYYLNAGEVESKGWEIEVTGRPAPGYEIQAGYARLDTVYLRDRNNAGLPFTTWDPRHTLKLWGVRRFGDGLLRGLSLGLGANVVSESASGTGSSAVRRQGGYAVVNAMASYRITPKVTLSLHLNNLTDRTYYTRLGGTNTYNTYGEPRNVSLALRADL